MSRPGNRFVPSLETLGERVNLSPAAPIGDPVTFTFTLGSLPAADQRALDLNAAINPSAASTGAITGHVRVFDGLTT